MGLRIDVGCGRKSGDGVMKSMEMRKLPWLSFSCSVCNKIKYRT